MKIFAWQDKVDHMTTHVGIEYMEEKEIVFSFSEEEIVDMALFLGGKPGFSPIEIHIEIERVDRRGEIRGSLSPCDEKKTLPFNGIVIKQRDMA